MNEFTLKIMKKKYYALLYNDGKHFAALSQETNEPYRVDDISLAWLRRDSEEFEDFCKIYEDLTLIRITFTIEEIKG